MKTKIIQITAGKGPPECTWVVAKLLKILLNELQVCKINYTILQQEKGMENGTVQSATIQLSGDDKLVVKFLKDWKGTIQWVGQSTFRKYNKRKNWFIGIFEIVYEQSLELQPNEIKYQAMRSSGPGGQHVNKVSSAIRAIHEPTGIQVVVMDTRSQHQNKKLAKLRLEGKVVQRNLEKFKASIKDQWKNHQELERGNPIKIFVGTDFKKEKTKKKYKQQRQQLKNDLRNKIE
ncbi:MAG: peptide chain release factor H [Flavobacteriaceae bacterium]